MMVRFVPPFLAAMLCGNIHGNPAATPENISVKLEADTPPDDECAAPPLKCSPPMKVCLIVEPSPFTYVSGYANRFQEMLRFMKQAGDSVVIITSDVKTSRRDLPKERFGYPVHHTAGVLFPFYDGLTLSLDWTLIIPRIVSRMKPDIIHVSTPGLSVFAALLQSRIFGVPLVMSYHTHLPVYIRKYLPFVPFLQSFCWGLIRVVHSFADLTLVTSPQIKREFDSKRVPRVEVWRKGINTDRFHPKFSSREMRHIMTNGSPNDFLILYVGRISKEKRVYDLKAILDGSPSNTRLCIVGTGPEEENLKSAFADNDHVVFTGTLLGDRLSAAFASADVFVLPSDSETLGFVVFEAMASGVPVVAARAGGLPSLIRGSYSFLVAPGNVTGYLQKLELLHEGAFRSHMGMLARRETEAWSWISSTSILRKVQYREATKNFESRMEVRVANWLKDKCAFPIRSFA